MSDDTRTLVLISLPMGQTPVAPHRPGTYVLGYVPGDQKAAHAYLNECKAQKGNAMIENAYMVQIGVEFEPEIEMDPQGRPVRGPDGGPIKTGNMGITQGFALMPLTNMDAVNGCDYGVEALHWVFPKGTMIQDLEAQMEHASSKLLHARTGMTQHRNVPQGMTPPGGAPRA
jgi:hypothetical protein